MAFTATMIVNTVPGNMRLWNGRITATNITGVVTIPGAVSIDAILAFHPLVIIGSTTCHTVYMNANASNVAEAGAIGFSNVISSTGAVYNLTVLYH